MKIQENPYIKRMLATTAAHIKAGDERQKKIKALEEKRDSLHTTPHAKINIMDELSLIPKETANDQVEYAKKIKSIADEAIAAIKAWGVPSGENLPDAAVLSGAITLTADDLTALEQKHLGNETWARMLKDYARKHNLQWMRRSPSCELKIKAMEEAAKYFSDFREDGMSAQMFTLYEMGQGTAVNSFLSRHDAIIGDGSELNNK